VLEILKRGIDVTWTDSDIVWLQNPIPSLMAMEEDFVVQSNAVCVSLLNHVSALLLSLSLEEVEVETRMFLSWA
jgi:hypothetical protein